MKDADRPAQPSPTGTLGRPVQCLSGGGRETTCLWKRETGVSLPDNCLCALASLLLRGDMRGDRQRMEGEKERQINIRKKKKKN